MAELREVSSRSRCSADSSVSSASSVIPMIPFIGVRSSWLMFARKLLLASLAASAIFLADSSSRRSSIALRYWALSCLPCASKNARQTTLMIAIP